MRLCNKSGNGVCLSCHDWMNINDKFVCRYKAEELLDCLQAIIQTEWTQEQEDIFTDFEITK